MKKISILISMVAALVLVFLTSCSQSSTNVYNSILNDENLTIYVQKGVTTYNSYASCTVESANYVALYNNSELSDAIYFEAEALIKVESETTSTTTTNYEEVITTIYFAYFPVAAASYPLNYDFDGEYKTAYTTAKEKLNAKTYNGNSGVYNAK